MIGKAQPYRATTFKKNGEGYEVIAADGQTIGFVMSFHPPSRIRRGRVTRNPMWSAVDMEENGKQFWSRKEAAEWLLEVRS